MRALVACFRAELVKWRKNWPLVVAVLAPVVQVGFLTLLGWYSDERIRVFRPGLRFWVELHALAWNLVVMPISAALITHLSWVTEAEARAWNHLMLQPLHRWNHYLVKIISHSLLMMGSFMLLQVLLPLGGWVLTRNELLQPWMGEMPWGRFLEFAIYGLAALVPVVVFQTWYSMRFTGLWGALTVVLIGTWVCVQLYGKTNLVQIFPWMANAMMVKSIERLVPIPWTALIYAMVSAVFWFILGFVGFRAERSPQSEG